MWGRTTRPTVTGSSVLGVVFEGGAAIAADTLASHNTLAKFHGCERVIRVNDAIILGCSGDYADFQYLRRHIEQKVDEEERLEDGYSLQPRALFTWLTRVLYSRRSRFDPLWLSLVLGGIQDGKPFLGSVDKLGNAFTSPHVATGYGAYLVLPSMRAHGALPPTRGAAHDLLAAYVKTLYYRDARASATFQVASVALTGGVVIEGPCTVVANWDVAYMIR